ncbi:MAG TPA: alpha/beta hydrolase, partial [Actinomycetes bacterium]|nr:alpha/beta hydrolase [Actinomycetes bacterium]
MEHGDVTYARVGDHHIAFREYVGGGAGDHEIVMVSGANFPMDSLLDDRIASRLVEGLAGLGRLVVFDRRGIALSDPVTDWETPLWEQWAEDLAAVVEASGCDRPTVFSWIAFPVARACSVQHPDRVGRLVLMNPRASFTEAEFELRDLMSQ